MKMVRNDPHRMSQTARIFLWAFLFACFLFWWVPSLAYVSLGLRNPVRESVTAISVFALAAFAGGYFLRPARWRRTLSPRVYSRCESLAWRMTLWLTLPALIVAVYFFHIRSGMIYGEGQGLSGLDQVVFYGHMYFGFLFLGTAQDTKRDRRRVLWASLMVLVPRLIVSLHWGRFFVVQAIAPILFIALARGWLRMSRKRWIQLACLGLAVIFVPAMTRGQEFGNGQSVGRFFTSGGTLKLFQDNMHLDLYDRCPPLLVSMTDGFVPYGPLGVCTIDVWGQRHLAATLDRILAYNQPSSDGNLTGPGANYLLELYLTGGIAAILAGSALFGFSCRNFVDWIGHRSLFAGVWAQCLTRALLAPRGTLGYVYQLIPGLVAATCLVILIAMAAPSADETAAAVEGAGATT